MSDAESPRRGTNRDRLLRAAIELIGEAGWGGVTTRAVAERAGVNQALVHYHFRSVPGLLREAAHAAMAATFEPAVVRLIETEDPIAALRGVFTALAQIDPETPESRTVIEATVQAVRDPELAPQVREMIAMFRDHLADRLTAAQQNGQLRSDAEPIGLAIALAGMLDGLALHRMIAPDLDIEAAERAVFSMLGVGA